MSADRRSAIGACDIIIIISALTLLAMVVGVGAFHLLTAIFGRVS